MQAVGWGQQIIWACRPPARAYPGLRQEGGNKRMEQSSRMGGICPYLTGDAMLLCRESIHPNSFRTASYPLDMHGIPLGDTRLESRGLGGARSLHLISSCWPRWTSGFAQSGAEPCRNGAVAVRPLPPSPTPALNLLGPALGQEIWDMGGRADKWRGQEFGEGQGWATCQPTGQSWEEKLVLPLRQRALEGRKALLGRRGGEEPLHKSEACAVCMCCSAKSGLKKELVRNWKKVSACNKCAIQI